jgi:hypothetical protein
MVDRAILKFLSVLKDLRTASATITILVSNCAWLTSTDLFIHINCMMSSTENKMPVTEIIAMIIFLDKNML